MNEDEEIEVLNSEVEVSENEDDQAEQTSDPDEFFAKNAFRIVYQTNNFFLPQIRDLIDKGEAINIRPEYQRRLRWSNQQKSKLIESLLLNIPVPPVFFYESDAARYEVMDGQQRLNAIREFFSGNFALTGLTALRPLNGIRYSSCPPRIKRALDRASLSAIVLLLESDTNTDEKLTRIGDIRRFVFDRLNTGGRKLNAQEIRNAISPGPLNQALVEMSRNADFTNVFGIPPYTEADPNDYYENPKRQRNSLYSSMRDCELVLRFVALSDRKNIRGSMKSMLDRAMSQERTVSEVEELKVRFAEALSKLKAIFEEDLFLLPADAKGKRRVSAAMYDAAMVAVDASARDTATFLQQRSPIRLQLGEAFKNDDTLELLTGRANTAESVRSRIDLFADILAA